MKTFAPSTNGYLAYHEGFLSPALGSIVSFHGAIILFQSKGPFTRFPFTMTGWSWCSRQ